MYYQLKKTVSMLVVTSIVLLTSALGTSSQDFPRKSIQIAAIFSTTGIAAQSNKSVVDMVKFTVDQLNASGGILGHDVELVILDNKSTPIGSAVAAKKAVELDVAAVIGGHWSSHSLAMAPILQKYKIPMISPASTNPEVTQDKDYVFRVCFLDSFQGEAMAHFAVHNLGVGTAVVLRNRDEKYSTTLAEYFSRSFESEGGRVLADMGYRGNATDFKEYIDTIIEKNPDVVYIPGYSRDSGFFVKQARKEGVVSIFLGGDGWGKIDDVAGDELDGSYQTVAWHNKAPYPSSKKLIEIYRNVTGKDIDSNSSPLAYDAVMVLKQAIEGCRCFEGTKIKEELQRQIFHGSTGLIQFNENGDQCCKEVIVVQYNGKNPHFIKTVLP